VDIFSCYQILEHISDWAKDSPLSEGTGNVISVQKGLFQRDLAFSKHYMNEVVGYVREWQNCAVTRIEMGLKNIKEYKQDLDHYEKKVNALKKPGRGGSPKAESEKWNDKVQRNEEKLDISREEYITHVNNLCNLINEAVDCSWKDLHPLLYRMMSLENDKLGDQAAIIVSSDVLGRLKEIAEEYSIDVTLPPPEALAPPKPDDEASPEGEPVPNSSEEEAEPSNTSEGENVPPPDDTPVAEKEGAGAPSDENPVETNKIAV
jgi:hypothetical protein